MDNMISFTAKASKVKTRTSEGKDYFVYRVNIPKEATDGLTLSEKEEYLFFKAMKAQWYQMLDWKEMPKTWEKLPEPVKKDIEDSGLYAPLQTTLQSIDAFVVLSTALSRWQTQTMSISERHNYCTPTMQGKYGS
jgi:hypothetical protein